MLNSAKQNALLLFHGNTSSVYAVVYLHINLQLISREEALCCLPGSSVSVEAPYSYRYAYIAVLQYVYKPTDAQSCVIRLYFALDALHVSDCISPSSGATFISCTSNLVYAGTIRVAVVWL